MNAHLIKTYADLCAIALVAAGMNAENAAAMLDRRDVPYREADFTQLAQRAALLGQHAGDQPS